MNQINNAVIPTAGWGIGRFAISKTIGNLDDTSCTHFDAGVDSKPANYSIPQDGHLAISRKL